MTNLTKLKVKLLYILIRIRSSRHLFAKFFRLNFNILASIISHKSLTLVKFLISPSISTFLLEFYDDSISILRYVRTYVRLLEVKCVLSLFPFRFPPLLVKRIYFLSFLFCLKEWF